MAARAADAFHVVCPSLPGYGFSDKPTRRGCGVERIAELWDELMVALGYEHYFAQGGDWGAAVTTQIGVQNRGHCRGIHLNLPIAPPPEGAASADAAERIAFAASSHYARRESGYAVSRAPGHRRSATLSPIRRSRSARGSSRSSRPGPTAMACRRMPSSRDELLDNVMMYWLTGQRRLVGAAVLGELPRELRPRTCQR